MRSPRSRIVTAALALALVVGVVPYASSSTTATAAPLRPGLALLQEATGTVTAIATLPAVPTASVTEALADLGLQVQPMTQLPLAIVRGPAAAVRLAATSGLAQDVYPQQRIELLDTASSNSMGAATTRAAKLTGKGVTVAVVDSGCDATHPDLADHVTHNVKLVSPEYANLPHSGPTTIVVPIDQGPVSNTDLGSGHGTHVAGIIAADGHTGPDHLGVAPDASLVCLSIGEVLFTTAVVTAYDHLLAQPGMWGVDVINNSWGNSYAQFDPKNPVAVATKAAAARNATVVFAAGNSGDGNGEATLNPFSQSPWVISVAAESVAHVRGSFSSNGIKLDNSLAVAPDANGRATFLGERIGLVHPDVAAPGVDISSTCATTGAAVGPCPPGENTVASGTSMASPHVAGAVAVLLQANPKLTTTQVRWLLQTTAKPVKAVDATGAATTKTAPFWQVGFGRVDLAAAVAAARNATAMSNLQATAAAQNSKALAATGYRVLRSDMVTWAAPPASLGTDVHTFTVARDAKATRLRVVVTFPSESTVGVGLGLTEYSVAVKDAKGKTIIATTSPAGIGAAAAFVLLPSGVSGPYTVTVTGDQSISDPDTLDSDSVLGDTVNVQVAQIAKR